MWTHCYIPTYWGQAHVEADIRRVRHRVAARGGSMFRRLQRMNGPQLPLYVIPKRALQPMAPRSVGGAGLCRGYSSICCACTAFANFPLDWNAVRRVNVKGVPALDGLMHVSREVPGPPAQDHGLPRPRAARLCSTKNGCARFTCTILSHAGSGCTQS